MNSTKKCAHCGSQNLFYSYSSAQGYLGTLLPGLLRLTKPSVATETYVCGDCRHIMFFLSEDEMPTLKSKWSRIS